MRPGELEAGMEGIFDRSMKTKEAERVLAALIGASSGSTLVYKRVGRYKTKYSDDKPMDADGEMIWDKIVEEENGTPQNSDQSR